MWIDPKDRVVANSDSWIRSVCGWMKLPWRNGAPFHDLESQIPSLCLASKLFKISVKKGYLHVSPSLAHQKGGFLIAKNWWSETKPNDWLWAKVHHATAVVGLPRSWGAVFIWSRPTGDFSGRMLGHWGRGRRCQRDGRFSNMFTHKYIYIYYIILYSILFYYIILYYIILYIILYIYISITYIYIHILYIILCIYIRV